MKEHARALFAGDLTPQEVPGDTFKAAMETPKHTSGGGLFVRRALTKMWLS